MARAVMEKNIALIVIPVIRPSVADPPGAWGRSRPIGADPFSKNAQASIPWNRTVFLLRRIRLVAQSVSYI
jgi:hypothetical protein